MKPVFDISPKPAPEPVFYGGKGAGIAAALKQQQADSSRVGVITSPSVPTQAEIGPQSLSFQTITIGPAQKYPVVIKGNYVYIEGIVPLENFPNALITVRPDTTQQAIPVSEQYREIRFPTPFNYVEISNPTGVSVTVTIWAGFGGVRRDYGTDFFTTGGALEISRFSGVYSAGHVLSNNTSPLSGIANRFTQKARIRKVVAINRQHVDLTAQFRLWLFSRDPGTFNYNDAFVFDAYASADAFQGYIDLTNWVTGDSTSPDMTCVLTGLDLPFTSYYDTTTGSTQLWVVLTTTKSYTPSAAIGQFLEIYITTEGS